MIRIIIGVVLIAIGFVGICKAEDFYNWGDIVFIVSMMICLPIGAGLFTFGLMAVTGWSL